MIGGKEEQKRLSVGIIELLVDKKRIDNRSIEISFNSKFLRFEIFEFCNLKFILSSKIV